MPWSNKDDNAAIDATKDWISVNFRDDPDQFRSWAAFRRMAFGCQFVPENFTVPSEYPPIGQAGANDYAQALSIIRKAVKWSDKRGRIPVSPQPWTGAKDPLPKKQWSEE